MLMMKTFKCDQMKPIEDKFMDAVQATEALLQRTLYPRHLALLAPSPRHSH